MAASYIKILGDSQNYMPPILVPCSAKHIDFILRVFVYDIIRNKELLVQI